MALSRPDAVVTVDGRRLTAAEAGLRRLEVRASVRGLHDGAVLWAWPGSKLADAAVGAACAIELGERDATIAVLTGEISAVGHGPRAVELEVLAATVQLSRARVVRSYLESSVSDIVRDLAGELTVDAVDGDAQLSAWYVDDRRPVWAWLRQLAARTGAELAASADGGLRFVRPTDGPSTTTLRAGAELLDWRLGPAPAPTAPTMAPHGAASEAGAERWHWLHHDPADGAPARIVGGFHAREPADALTEALGARVTRASLRGRLVATGDAELRPGAVLGLEGVRGADTVRVLDVTHVLDAERGFVTALVVEGVA